MAKREPGRKSIAKNTGYLYVRMLVTMLITLYTSRVVLRELGVDDFGVYNVVGSIVLMFGFLNSSMAISIQRFLSYEMGRHDSGKLRKVFCMSVNINIVLALLVAAVSATLGDWLLVEKLNLPAGSLGAAKWVFGASIAGVCFSILRIPYIASLTAHEDFKVYAWLGIVEALLNLGIAMALTMLGDSRLVWYAFMMAGVVMVTTLFFAIYASAKYGDARYRPLWDGALLRQLGSFAGWSACGEVSWAATNYGVNFVLNVFCGVVLNTARGLSHQIVVAVSKFVTNFQSAVNPRMIIMYAEGDKAGMMTLLIRSTRLSVYLMAVFALPFLLETRPLLELWLGEVPPYAVVFCQWGVAGAMLDVYSNLIATAVKAHGSIRNYQLWVSAVLFLNLPLSYLALKLGFAPESVMCVYAIVSAALLFVRLAIVKGLLGFPVGTFCREMGYTLLVLGASAAVPLLLKGILPEGNWSAVAVCGAAVVSLLVFSYLFGISRAERETVNSKLKLVFCR